ncbi:reverse transcriptase [Plakobranchus ocellatus]|uniref:Reverse transcriptase n=1 Tax=Plakobranchus ocellatus TaxID=259542 RepID=A0AAV4D908_9GAST|nr:reverse transcriptase [Plakobranchus ocellatus]
MESHGRPYGNTGRGTRTGVGINHQYCIAAEANLYHQIFEHITHEKFKQAKVNDDTLNGVKKLAKKGDRHLFKDGLIYRLALNNSDDVQTVTPTKFRETVLKICCDVPTVGHMGVSTTKKRVGSRFSWPQMMSDHETVAKFILTDFPGCRLNNQI